MAKKYITSLDELSRLSRKIVKSHPWGFVGAIVEGARGRGKSAFLLHTGREVYQYLEGLSRDEAWERLLGIGNYRKDGPRVIFDLEEMVKILDILDRIDFENILEWQKENTIPYIGWDDAGMHASKYKFFTDRPLVEALQGEMDTIRFIMTALLATTPEAKNLLSFFHQYKDQYHITIKYSAEGSTKYDRIAEVREWFQDPLGRYRKRIAWRTRYSCYVDKWVYEEYTKMKAKALKKNKDKFKKIIEIALAIGKKKEEVMEEMGFPDEYESLLE